jgi:cyclophilin family peptidyl-prolyl cis-trans isomerase
MVKKYLPYIFLLVLNLFFLASYAQQDVKLKKKDLKRDIEMVTDQGIIVLRLYDSTPLHRDNFLRLVKSKFYDSLLFHRVIKDFMIQGGDPDSKRAEAGKPLGNGGLGRTIPAEFRTSIFHKRGVLAAARDENPEKASSSTQFYIVQGKKFSDAGLDSVETIRLGGRKLPPAHRAYYKEHGGTPHLDQRYTVFGEVVKGMEVVDKIAYTPTSKGIDKDRPLKNVRIIKARLVKRKKIKDL